MPSPFNRGLGYALQIAIVVWASATLAFLTLHLTPGDPIDVLLVNAPEIGEAEKQAIRVYYGLDKPLPVQYLVYLGNLATGDLGFSYRQQRSVFAIIEAAFWPTLRVTALAILFAAAYTFASALFSATGRAWRARLAGAVEILLIAVPAFWLGVAFLTIFSFHLRWFPSAGDESFAALVLPALTLALAVGARIARVFRRGVEVAEQEPFALSARARGLSQGAIRRRHSSAHALIGTLTLGGMTFAELLGGAVLVESIFSRPGLGRELVGAVVTKDIPVVMALVVLSSLVFATVNIVIDASYRRIDPRVGHS
jgi:peptide/nickel transport system permease protein